jgi:hypothetical protein
MSRNINTLVPGTFNLPREIDIFGVKVTGIVISKPSDAGRLLVSAPRNDERRPGMCRAVVFLGGR